MALSRLQRICDAKFISVRDFENNPLRIFAAHELAAIIDPAMATKMTVQVSLSNAFTPPFERDELTQFSKVSQTSNIYFLFHNGKLLTSL